MYNFEFIGQDIFFPGKYFSLGIICDFAQGVLFCLLLILLSLMSMVAIVIMVMEFYSALVKIQLTFTIMFNSSQTK